ncbi:MAG TPA: PBP1A family penicillin-binding protein [Pyrinomonadaceae bacterium]|jgi:penicillin-binding protein 1B
MAIEVTSVHERRPFPKLKRAGRASSRQVALVETSRRRKIIFRFILAALGVLTLSAIGFLIHSYNSYSKLIDERLASGYLTSRAGIYAAPRELRVGQSLSRDGLVALLRRAGYIEKNASDVWSGSFTAQANSVEIRPRRMSGQSGPSIVTVSFDKNKRIAELTGDALSLSSYRLEPELLTADASMKAGKRAALSYSDIPPVLAHAILSIEDHRFFEHRGVDFFGIARAFLRNVGDNEAGQGGSTITQQLVKNTYLSPERTYQRKYAEAMISLSLERRLSKEDIFALYCNEIYLGQRGAVGVRGVEQAARIFFGKDLKDLRLAEAATIAGMIQSPSRYAPDRHPEEAKARRQVVLDAMLRDGAITIEEAVAAAQEPLHVAPAPARDDSLAPYFIDYVNRVSEAQLNRAGLADERGLRVYTTINLDLQQLAEDAVRHQLERLDKIYKGRKGTPQVALVALDPKTGDVLAMVGGRNYAESQLNRATDALRQPGSVFKPIVYAAALESGISPVSMYEDAPREFIYDRRATYHPANYGGAYSMHDVMMRTGLVKSLNVVTVDVAMRVGLPRVASVAEKMGLPKPQAFPALALGTTEATPLDIAAAYTAFANNGQRVEPRVIARATDATGAEIIGGTRPPQQVIKPTTAYLITDMLADVIDHGTARAARGAVPQTVIAGKTGTSRDGWFVGYTPNLVCAVWIGFDDNKQLGLTGADAALPAWTEFVKGAVELRPELGGERFERPAGVTLVEVDPETGLLAGPTCPQRERIAITGSLAPTIECYAHGEFDDFYTEASASEIYPPMERVVIPPDSARTLTRDASTIRQQPLPRAETNAWRLQPPPGNRTRVEADASGQRTLVNEMRVNGSGKNR